MNAWWLPSVNSWWNFNLSINRFLTYFSFPCWTAKQKPLWFHLSLISVGILAPVGHKKYTTQWEVCAYSVEQTLFLVVLLNLVGFYFSFSADETIITEIWTLSPPDLCRQSLMMFVRLVGVPGSILPCCFEVGKVMESSEWQPVTCQSSYELKIKAGICIWVCFHHV